MPTNDAPAADRLAARLDELEVAAFDCGRLGNSSATLRRKEAARKAVEIVVRLAASGEPPREPSEEAIKALVDAMEAWFTAPDVGGLSRMAYALRAAYAAEAAAPRAPHAPDGPWRLYPATNVTVPGDFYLSCSGRGDGVTRYAGPFTEAEARAALPALNRVAASGGAPQP